MAQTQSVTPLEYAVALVGAHPELSTPVPGTAAVVTGYIQSQTNSLNQLATVISSQGPATTAGGWAQMVKVGVLNTHPVYQYNVSAQTLNAAVGLLQNTLMDVKQDTQLQNVLWTQPTGTSGSYQPVVPPADGYLWTARNFAPLHGVAVQTVSVNQATRQMQIEVQNQYPFTYSVYVEFLDDEEKPIIPEAWATRLPSSVASLFETQTVKFLGLLQPTVTQEGIPLTVEQLQFSCTAPAGTQTLRLSFGTLGSGTWSGVLNPPALVITGVLGYAVPWMLKAAGAYVSPSWYNQLLADEDIVNEVLSAGAFLATCTSNEEAIQALAERIGELLFGGTLPKLLTALQSVLDTKALINAAQGINWSLSTLSATNQAGVSSGVVETLAVPALFYLDITWDMIAQRTLNLLPDPLHEGWPVTASSYEVQWPCDDNTGTLTGEMNGLLTPLPLSLTVDAPLPSYSPMQVNVTVYDAEQNVVARASDAGTTDDPLSVTVAEVALELGAATYRPLLQLNYDSSTGYGWEAAQANAGTAASLDCSNVGRSFCEPAAIAYNAQGRALAFSWRASGQNVPPVGSRTVTSQQLYVPQAISIGASPQAGLQTSTYGYLQRVQIVCGPNGAADGLFLATTGSTSYLRPVSLGQAGTFEVPEGSSLGCLTLASLDDFACTANGAAGAICTSAQVLQIVPLSGELVADAEAPKPFTVGGSGARVGLLSNPVAVAATPDSNFVVLEAGNKRLQAFDALGNPAPYFAGSPVLQLNSDPSVRYLDVEVDAYGDLYVLYSQGDDSQAANYRVDVYTADGQKVSSTAGVNAARLTVDLWRNLYTLDYTLIDGPGGAPIPSVRVWSALSSTF